MLKKNIKLPKLDFKHKIVLKEVYSLKTLFVLKKNNFFLNILTNKNSNIFFKSKNSLDNSLIPHLNYLECLFFFLKNINFFIFKVLNLFFFRKIITLFVFKKSKIVFKNFNFFFSIFSKKKIKSIKKNLKKNIKNKNNYFFY